MKEWISKYLTSHDLEAIKNEIAEVEKSTSGEIRLSLRDKRTFFEKLYKPRELAVRDFERLGMANTRQKTGILIFIIFSEQVYEILADEGIYGKISDSVWYNLEAKLKEEFRNGKYLNGFLHLIDGMGEILMKEFPVEAGDVDELPDEAVIN